MGAASVDSSLDFKHGDDDTRPRDCHPDYYNRSGQFDIRRVWSSLRSDLGPWLSDPRWPMGKRQLQSVLVALEGTTPESRGRAIDLVYREYWRRANRRCVAIHPDRSGAPCRGLLLCPFVYQRGSTAGPATRGGGAARSANLDDKTVWARAFGGMAAPKNGARRRGRPRIDDWRVRSHILGFGLPVLARRRLPGRFMVCLVSRSPGGPCGESPSENGPLETPPSRSGQKPSLHRRGKTPPRH